MKKEQKAWKILVVGYGSMGKRRIRILRKLVKNVQIACMDSSPERRCEAQSAGLDCYADLEQALAARPDAAFVCTPPGGHAQLILRLLDAGADIFTELNLVDDRYDEMIKKAGETGSRIFMSSTMLYNSQIRRIQEAVKTTQKPLTYVYHVGQYLPDWHPWEDYKDFFASRTETNGVKEILAIQLPWMFDTFGDVEMVHAVSQSCTDLDISFPDSVAVSFVHKTGTIGVFVADVVSRSPVVSLEVIGEDLHLFWNGRHDGIRVYRIQTAQMERLQADMEPEHQKGYSELIAEEPYQAETRDFLDMLERGSRPRYSLEQDKYTLSVINRIEELTERGGL